MDTENFEYLDDLFEPILIADQDGVIKYYNSSFLTLFKTTPRGMKKQINFKEYFSSIIPGFTSFYDELVSKNQMLSPELNFIIEEQECTIIIKGSRK